MPDPESSLPIQAPARPATDPTEPGLLPPWKVLLHNDDVNDMPYVVQTISQLTPLSQSAATQRMLEAHAKGLALILTTHQERAELYRDQFASKNLSVTIEPDA
ncbi:MAG: ATP-dependent Clp protease adaptor ClpS [Phycisphaerae bacterium]|nr:ATP-dependent Clp protease adaptor ClpS [Phycisphaerae bacterium]